MSHSGESWRSAEPSDQPRPFTRAELEEIASAEEWSWQDAEIIQRLLATIAARDKEIAEVHSATQLLHGLDQQVIKSSEKEIETLEKRIRELGG